MADSSQVETAARAVHAALDFQSSSESRLAATAYLESLKSGDVQTLGAIAAALVKQVSLTSEVRHYGLKLLQYLVRIRWDELTVQTRAQLVDLVFGMLPEIATSQDEWFLKSQTAALVAEVVRHEDTSLWQGFLSKFADLAALSPAYAELIVTVLRWLPEDITVYNEDLEGDRRRQLLQSLTQALFQIFPLFYKMLESHFSEAVRCLQQNQPAVAKEHAAVVNASLSALLAYVEWAPVDKIAENGLIEACGFLLNAAEFRQRSAEIMKQISARKRPTDETVTAYDAALRRVLEILCQASGSVQGGSLTNNEDDSEFAECLSEAMTAVGSQNMQCFIGLQNYLTSYLQQMLQFFRNSKIGVHFPALGFWLALVREIPLESANEPNTSLISDKLGVAVSVTKDNKKSVIVLVSEQVYAVLLDCAFNWFYQKSSKVQADEGSKDNEELSDMRDYGNYRARVLDLVRSIAERAPLLCVVKISEKVKEACGLSNMTKEMMLLALECSQKLLEVIIHAIFDGEKTSNSTLLYSLQSHLEGMLGTLLMAKWTDAAFVEAHGQLLDALGPFLKTSSHATLRVLNKIFELLTSLPMGTKGNLKDQKPIDNSRSRLQVCTSFLRIAKAADKTVSAHLEAIWKTISTLQEQHLLQQGEYNLIAEAFLVAGSAAGGECEAKALECFLNPIQERWTRTSIQEHYLNQPEDLVGLLVRQTVDNSQNEELWFIYHSFVFTERVVKRVASQHPDLSHGRVIGIEYLQPLVRHIQWIISPILQLLRCIHAFWSPGVKPSLPNPLQLSLLMSTIEQASVIGETGPRVTRGNRAMIDSDMNAVNRSGGNENEIRNWLKGIRDSCYGVIGLAATHFNDILFGHNPDTVQLCIYENIEAMELRHVRLLLHFVVIPLVKSCPPHLREIWLIKLLPGPLALCDSKLTLSWTSLIKDGTLKLSEGVVQSEGLGIKAEVLQEKLLRDLSREICALLAVMASPNMNPSLPSGEQLLQFRSEPAKLENQTIFGPDCLMRLVMQHDTIAKASLSLSTQALKWPDSEAVHKALAFCGATVTVAVISGNGALQNYVAQDLFTTVIDALTVDSNASAQAELISLFRVIYLLMAERHSAPRQILQSSPSITSEVLSAFENALATTSSAKEQKQYIKSLLLQAGGNTLKALLNAKTPNTITNVANRSRGASQVSSTESEDTGTIGLAGLNGEHGTLVA